MSKQKFKTEVSKLLDIVINSLYSEKYIFLRELISNASDACDKLRYYALTNPGIAKNNGEFKIVIKPDSTANTLTISDNGIGMNKDDLVNHLGTIAKSGTADFINNAKDNGSIVDLIGKFGVGFYSAFMVADKVEVTTRRADEEQAYLWTSNGVSGFEITETEREKIGTDIKLYLKDDAKDFTDTVYLRHIVRTYSDHINYPIVLDLGEVGEENINEGSALWTKNKADITDDQYNEFYHHISRNFDTPWMRLHFKAEGSIEYTGLLYIPSEAPYDLFQPDRQQSLKLYVNRVFISDKVDDLMPAYLRFVKGIIDSADLPLNISREMLQQNALIAKIKNGTVGRVLKELKKRSEDYDDYMKFWKTFGVAFKEGIYEDRMNREEVALLSRFYSTNDAEHLTSLDEYISRVQEGQTNIYYITGDDIPTLRNNPQLEAFKAKNLEVLLLVDPIDEFWVQVLTNYKGYPLKHISQADIDLKLERDAPKADEAKLKKLTDFLAELFKNEVSKVVPTEKLTNSPVSLTVENGQMSIHLERLMRNHQQSTTFASSRILEVNPYHPLIIKLADNITDESQKETVEEVSRLLLDQAKIAEGEAVTDSSFFNEKLSDYILRGWQKSA
ncbi:MAG: molecular chaperone HtpG [Alphaproteobacteria bacterium]|nr:molecular chaperone HtpG [Alphaproteobacteria bacterium]